MTATATGRLVAAPALRPRPRPARRSFVDLAEALDVDDGGCGPAVRTTELRPGGWIPPVDPKTAYVVADGAILSVLRVGRRAGAELLGQGDVLTADAPGEPFQASLRVLAPSRVAALDARAWSAVAADARLVGALHRSVCRRTTAATDRGVLLQLAGIEDRLGHLLPGLGERWGVMSPQGVVLPAFLSHSVLAMLAGVRRPSLTTALGRLVQRGDVQRLADRRWLLGPGLGRGA